MTYNYYPKNLPLALQSGYSMSYKPAILRTTMTDGTVRQRLLNVGANAELKCSIMFGNQTEYNEFLQFYKSINYGADWFVMPVVNESATSDNNINYRLVRLQSGKYSSSLVFNNGNIVRKITITCDVDELKLHDDAWAKYYEG